MAEGTGLCIAHRDRVERMLDRMARQIAATLDREFALVGIRRRGAPLAGELAGRLSSLTGHLPPVDTLKLKRYTDDLALLHEHPQLEEANFSFDLEGATVLLVDDVLYTGRTLLRATSYLAAGGAEQIRGAVLCYRGPNEVPVTADFIGMHLNVGSEHVVEVHTPPYEEDLTVVVKHWEDVEREEPASRSEN